MDATASTHTNTRGATIAWLFRFTGTLETGGLAMKIAERIDRLLEFNSTLTAAEIARTLGTSRQLVHYHTKKSKLPRQRVNRTCASCGNRISRYNQSGFCKAHISDSYAYEYQCAQCGTVRVVKGRDAINRRNSKK